MYIPTNVGHILWQVYLKTILRFAKLPVTSGMSLLSKCYLVLAIASEAGLKAWLKDITLCYF